MNVDVVQNEVTKIVIIEERLERLTSNSPSDNKELIITVAFSVVGGIILIIVLLCLCKIHRRRRRYRKNPGISSNSTTTTSSAIYNIPIKVPMRTTEDVTRRYERSVSSLSTKSQVYLVPFAVLPPNFDFSSREVEVKADYVILKDLKLLERQSSSDNEGVVNDAYDQQESYNPYYGTIPPLVREPYKKQTPYNPTFY